MVFPTRYNFLAIKSHENNAFLVIDMCYLAWLLILTDCGFVRGYPSGGTLSTDVVALSGQNVATTELNNYGGLPSSQSYNGGVLLNTKSDPNYPMVVVNQYVDQSVRHPTNEFYSNQFGGVNSVVIAKGGQPKGGQSCEGLYRVLSLSHFATAYYGPSLQRTPVKVIYVFSLSDAL